MWGVLKVFQQTVAFFERRRLEREQNDAAMKALQRAIEALKIDLNGLRKDVTPNGKNTQQLGDIAARTEEKVNNLTSFMERYAEKVDDLVAKLQHHLGVHEGLES